MAAADNFEADRQAAEQVIAANPNILPACGPTGPSAPGGAVSGRRGGHPPVPGHRLATP